MRRVECDHCGAWLNIADGRVGIGRCPKCGVKFEIPGEEAIVDSRQAFHGVIAGGVVAVFVLLYWLVSIYQGAIAADALVDALVLISNLVLLILPLLLFAVYMLPTVIAYNRRHHNAVPIGIVNVCFGWTFIGYVVALAWAFSSPAMRAR